MLKAPYSISRRLLYITLIARLIRTVAKENKNRITESIKDIPYLSAKIGKRPEPVVINVS